MEKGKLHRPLLFFGMIAFLEVVVVNSLIIHSWLVGAIASLGLLSLISIMIAKVLFSNEDLFFRCLFGFATLLLLLSVVGFGLMLLSAFTQMISLIALAAMSIVLGAIFLGKKSEPLDFAKTQSVNRVRNWKNALSYVAVLAFLFYVAIDFRYLLLARTSEGGSSVWLGISPFFVPVFALSTLLLGLILFFSPAGSGTKLVLIIVYSFLVHSLFLIVWYPSRYGDPLSLLGQARFTANTGGIYAYDWLTSHFLIEGIIAYKAQFALTIFFQRMFSIDIYWAQIPLIPLLWSIFVPSLAYSMAELLNRKRSRILPPLAALLTALIPSLILWGAVSVPNSLGFIFFFASAVLLLKWMSGGGRSYWLTSLLISVAALFAHPQPGLFSLMLFFWGNVVHGTSRRILRIAGLILAFSVYPIALYLDGASFLPYRLFSIQNFYSFESQIVTIFLLLGVVGLAFGLKSKYVKGEIAMVLFIFFITILSEYYLTEFGMTNMPYGAGRILVMADLLVAPFTAFGLLALLNLSRDVVTRGRNLASLPHSSGTKKLHSTYVLIAAVLICVFLSAQATSAMYQGYPLKEAVDYQPPAYMIDAVQFINNDAPKRYDVLCDPIVASVASGFLGVDYSYGFFGLQEWDYPLQEMFWKMINQPSISIMKEAMVSLNASVNYFVVWKGIPNSQSIVQRTMEILPLYRAFDSSSGEEALWIFKYPLPITEELGPQVRVAFDDGSSSESVTTKLVYMFRSEINSTITLSGHLNYNITAYPINWTFLDLTVNRVPAKFSVSSDPNYFLYVNVLNSDDQLTVTWRVSPLAEVIWKDDSFKIGWGPKKEYAGAMIKPSIHIDEGILNMSYSFPPGVTYDFYYYVKAIGITTQDNDELIIRWKCDAPIGYAFIYFKEGGGQEIISLGSQSGDWATTVVKLPSSVTISDVMVGVNDQSSENVYGFHTFFVDYILIGK